MEAQTSIRVGGRRVGLLRCGEGPTALVLHGFPDEADSMRGLLEGLAARGYGALAPYLPGYPPSDPLLRHRLDLAADWVHGLIDAFGGPALLIGHDWGAPVAYMSARLSPERVRAVVGLSVPPLRMLESARARQVMRSRYMLRFQLPGAARGLRKGGVERLWRRWSPGWTPPLARIAAARDRLSPPGAMEAAVSWYRHQSPAVGTLMREPIPTPALVLGGTRDGCIGPEVYRKVPRGTFAAAHRVTLIEGAGHWLPLEACERVLAELDTFLAI